MISNHFASGGFGLPSMSISKTVNAEKTLRNRLDNCQKLIGKRTNLLVVDFWSLGDVLKVVKSYNSKLSRSGKSISSSKKEQDGFGCFSGDTFVKTKQSGIKKMKEIQIGDLILVSSKDMRYEAVYGFGHLDPSRQMEFIQFQPSNLEITWNHLVMVEGKGIIPAIMVRVGDVLEGGTEVTKISHVLRQGVFAPFTASGKLIVNGVLASNYISFNASPVLTIGSISLPISYHWMAHSFQVPHRIWCTHLRICPTNKLSGSKMSTWVDLPYRGARWLTGQSSILTFILWIPLLVLLVLLSILETSVFSMYCQIFCFLTIILARRCYALRTLAFNIYVGSIERGTNICTG
jgi:hypothetical protein